MIKTIKKQWFVSELVLIFLSVVFDKTDKIALMKIFIKNSGGSSIMIVCIFLLSGMILDIDQIKSGLKDTKSTFAALFLIVVVSPFIAVAMSFFPLKQELLLVFSWLQLCPTKTC